MSKDKEFAMSEIMNSYEEEREKMASVAMQDVYKRQQWCWIRQAVS